MFLKNDAKFLGLPPERPESSLVSSSSTKKNSLFFDGVQLRKYKTGVFIRKFPQIHAVNHEEAFEVVVRLTTLKSFLLIAVCVDLDLHQTYEKLAFTPADLMEGYTWSNKTEVYDARKRCVRDLWRALERLRQAPG